MLRLTLLALFVAASACAPASTLPPDEALAQANAAIEAGETGTAHRFLTIAAEGGNLDAMAMLAWGYRVGYYTQSHLHPSQAGSGHTQLPTRRDEAKAMAWTKRYLEAVRQPSSDPDQIRIQALDLLNGQPSARAPYPFLAGVAKGAPEASAAQRDSAVALLSGLIEAGDADAAYLLSQAATDPDDRDQHLDRAVALGSATACFSRAFQMSGPTARETAAHFDAFEACAAMPGASPALATSTPRAATDRTLRREIADGNADARALRDSLVALGAFSDA